MKRKRILFGLNAKDIDRVIREVNAYRDEVIRKCNELIRQLTEYGYEFAKFEVLRLGSFDTGNLADSIEGFFDEQSRVGFVKADCWYAVYVEYGTGVVGAGQAHPAAGTHGWVYDINHHGESGWVYWSGRDGQFHWTKGQPSHPFMYNTMRELQQQARSMAASIFR